MPTKGGGDHLVELADVAEDEAAQERAERGGAITRNGSTFWVSPERSMPAWSMWVPPASIVATMSTLRSLPLPTAALPGMMHGLSSH